MEELRVSDLAGGKPLITRLVEAKLSGHRRMQGSTEYHFRSNEMAANMALNTFVGWLVDRGELGLARDVVEGRA
jgi:hypothetical protein